MKRRIAEKANKLFEYILKFQAKNGFPPSLREMGAFMGISSTSTVSYYLDYLSELGLIRRDLYKNRAIEILNGKRLLPDDSDSELEGFNAEKKIGFNMDGRLDFAAMSHYCPIPILGQITAGQPVFADENCEDVYYMPSNLFKGSDLFMLKVRGSSMIEAGIYDGDLVVVQKQDTAENGEIVAALVEDSATVKKFYKEDNMYRLQPANSAMSPMYFKEVTILGKIVGLIRSM